MSTLQQQKFLITANSVYSEEKWIKDVEREIAFFMASHKIPKKHIHDYLFQLSNLGNFNKDDLFQITLEILRNTLEVSFVEEYLFVINEAKEKEELEDIMTVYKSKFHENLVLLFETAKDISFKIINNDFSEFDNENKKVFYKIYLDIKNQKKANLLKTLKECLLLNSFYKNYILLPVDFHLQAKEYYTLEKTWNLRKKALRLLDKNI